MRLIDDAPLAAVVLAVLALVLGTTLAELFSPVDLAFTLAYLLPLGLSAWRLPRVAVVAVAFLCAACWFVVHYFSRAIEMPLLVALSNVAMELCVFLAFGLLLHELRRRLGVERRLARTDMLTGMPNRRAFHSELQREIARCRSFGQPFSLAYLDVDDFKQINDRLGHAAGDGVLRAVASSLQACIRRVDLVARLGGDEFGVLLPGTDAFGADVVMRRVQSTLRENVHEPFGVSCSIGCLTVLKGPPDIEALIAKADRLMYEQKSQGRGSFRHETLQSADGG